MKKNKFLKFFSILFIFLMAFSFTACKGKKNKITESDELKFEVKVDYENCCFILTYDFGEEKNNFVEAGFVYALNYTEEEKLHLGSENYHFRLIDMGKEDKSCTISLLSSRTKIVDYTFRGYIKRSNGNIIYSSDQKVISVDSERIIFTLNVNVDLQKYKVLDSNSDVNVELTQSKNLDYIYLKVTPNNEHVFFSHITVKVNNKDVKEKDFKLENNVITITIEDPNWTEIY